MLSERMRRDREGQMAAELSAAYRQAERAGEPLQFLNRHDSVGTAAKSLVSRLREDIASDAVPMFYQPQVDESGRVIGAEALLRWKFAGETVFPPLVVALAQEDGLFDTLTSCILRRVCRETRELCVKTGTALSVSVNITAQQLNSPHFVEEVIRTAEEAGAAARLCLEVTEETSLSSFDQIALQIDRLHEAGITVAIDDFSMGSTSLKYLQTHAFQYIKLDGSLVRRMTENPRSREIVASIVALGETLGFTVVAEYVETQDVRDALCALGCRCYQGYLFSPAVAPDAFVAYCLEQNRGDAR